MSKTLELIEDYFSNKLSLEDKIEFERRCETDPEFCQEVGFYISARDALKAELHQQKKKDFEELYKTLSAKPVSRPVLIQLFPYLSAVAACVLLFFGWLFFVKKPTPRQLANQYVTEQLHNLPVTMGNQKDSLQMGIEAFNNKNYKMSENILILLSGRTQTRSEAVKYLGFVYLVTGQYDKAVQQFDTLSMIPGLHANAGLFHKAVAKIMRSEGKDAKEAEVLLDEVVQKKLPGYKEALEWKQY